MAQGGQKAAAVEAAGAAGPARQRNRPRMYVKVRLVYAHNTILHVRFADMKMRYVIMKKTPKWIEPLILYVRGIGAHKVIKRYHCSKVTGLCGFYKNYVYEAEITPTVFIKLITFTPTWKKSTVAKEIIKKINELTSGYE